MVDINPRTSNVKAAEPYRGPVAEAAREPREPDDAPAPPAFVSVTVFTSDDRLSKRFEPGLDESILKTSGVQFASGTAQRFDIPLTSATDALKAFGEIICGLSSRQAIGLGVPKNGARDNRITTKDRKANGQAGPAITRSLEDFTYPAGPGFLLIDGDGVTGLRRTLIRLWPAFTLIATLTRPSASSGIRHSGTGEELEGGGEHLYLPIDDVSRSKEVLDALMRLAWVRGFGTLKIAANGMLLVRGPVDVSVGSPERLSYEGAPVIVTPIEAAAERELTLDEGDILQVEPFLDYAAREAPEARFEELKQEAARDPDLIKQQRAIHEAYLARTTARKVETGAAPEVAEAEAAAARKAFVPGRLQAGRLTATLTASDVFEAADGRVIRLADVLARPEAFDGIAGADPSEGASYGRSTAMLFAGTPERGGPFIRSFAHGGIIYQIRPAETDPQRRRRRQIRQNTTIGEKPVEPELPTILTIPAMEKRLVYLSGVGGVADQVTGRVRKKEHAFGEYAASTYTLKEEPEDETDEGGTDD